jgi:hypothetical protein
MDDWTREVLAPLAAGLGARAVFPFDEPHPPFLRWAQLAGAGFTCLRWASTSGLTLACGMRFARPSFSPGRSPSRRLPPQSSPCDACADKPCLAACPVNAFSGTAYDVEACAGHLASPPGAPCRETTCLARLACPVAPGYRYAPGQMRFHMVAFMQARGVDPAQFD